MIMKRFKLPTIDQMGFLYIWGTKAQKVLWENLRLGSHFLLFLRMHLDPSLAALLVLPLV